MEVTARPRANRVAFVLVTTALLLSQGCEQLQMKFSGKKDQGPQLTELRKKIADYRSRFMTAVNTTEATDIPGLIAEGGRLLDSVEKQAETMSFMDGQAIKIDVASGRRILTDARGFSDSNDMDGVRQHREKLDGVLFDIDSILARAAAMTDNEPTAGT